MATDKPIINFVMEPELLERVDDFRFARRFPSRAAAIKWLIARALENEEASEGGKSAHQRTTG